jgi:hypothetical protein
METAPRTCRRSFPAASSSAWPSRARWSTIRRSFSPTSPPATSTPKISTSCSACSAICMQGRTIVMVTHDENAGRWPIAASIWTTARVKETLVFTCRRESGFRRSAGAPVDAPASPRSTMESNDFTEMQWRKSDRDSWRASAWSILRWRRGAFTPARRGARAQRDPPPPPRRAAVHGRALHPR